MPIKPIDLNEYFLYLQEPLIVCCASCTAW
jgi:hypothetical protein